MRKMLHQKPAAYGRGITVCLVLICLIGTLFAPTAFAATTGQVLLPVRQVFERDGSSIPSGGEVFTYRLTPQTPNAPMPSGSGPEGYTFTIAGTRESQVGPLTFDTTGIYLYELRCVTATNPGYTVDQRVYVVEVHITSALEAVVIVYDSNNVKVSELLFTHSYGALTNRPVTMVDPPVRKIVNGNPATASTFTFRLEAEQKSNPMPVGSVNGVKTVTIIGAGETEFGTWTYAGEGTFRYTVSELNSGAAGYAYDKTVYTITDVVTAADGQLVVARTITNNTNQQVSELAFVNTYTGPGTSNPSGGGGNEPSGKPGDGPKTGDFSNPVLWMTLIAASTTLLLFILIIARKVNRRSK